MLKIVGLPNALCEVLAGLQQSFDSKENDMTVIPSKYFWYTCGRGDQIFEIKPRSIYVSLQRTRGIQSRSKTRLSDNPHLLLKLSPFTLTCIPCSLGTGDIIKTRFKTLELVQSAPLKVNTSYMRSNIQTHSPISPSTRQFRPVRYMPAVPTELCESCFNFPNGKGLPRSEALFRSFRGSEHESRQCKRVSRWAGVMICVCG